LSSDSLNSWQSLDRCDLIVIRVSNDPPWIRFFDNLLIVPVQAPSVGCILRRGAFIYGDCLFGPVPVVFFVSRLQRNRKGSYFDLYEIFHVQEWKSGVWS